MRFETHAEDIVLSDEAQKIWTKGEIMVSGVKPDGKTKNNIAALVHYKGDFYICEAYVNVSLHRMFIRCFTND